MNPIHSDYAPMVSRGRGRTNLANPALTVPVSPILPQPLTSKVMTFPGISTPALWEPSIEPHRELRRPSNNYLLKAASPVGNSRGPTTLSQHSPLLFSTSPTDPLPSWSTVAEDLLVFPNQQGRGRLPNNPYRWVREGVKFVGMEYPAVSETDNDPKEPIDETLRLYQDAEDFDLLTPERFRTSNEMASDPAALAAATALSAANQLAAMQLSRDSETKVTSPTQSLLETQRTKGYPPPAPFTPHRGNEAPNSATKNPYKWTRGDARTSPNDSAKLSPQPKHSVTELSPRSTLSVEAKVFVPRSKPSVESEEAYRPIYKAPERGRHSEPESNVDRAVRVLCSSMHVMSLEPASFHRESPPLIEAFAVWLTDPAVTHAAVSVLMERALSDANFRFNGARLCAALNNTYGACFTNVLMGRCREEHERIAETLVSAPARAQGFAAFGADLFVTLETAQGSRRRIPALGGAVMDTMVAMLREPTHEHVKCVCHTLKLVGYHLESCDKSTLDAILSRLEALCADRRSPAISQLLVANLVKLRSENWGIGHSEAAAAPVESPPVIAPGLNEPTFYGPDGAILTAEESEFLQEQFSDDGEGDCCGTDDIWVEDEEMDEEIQAAFEQFLLLNKPK